jgi:hypothetical protein
LRAEADNVIASPSGRSNLVLLVIAVAIILAVFLFVDPIPQDLAYHRFADTRTLFGVPNFWNVASNLPFLIVGIWGMAVVSRRRIQPPELRPAYLIFYFGIFMTGFGSGYFHLVPSNDSLVLDRLPMTIGFAGMFAVVLGEVASIRLARRVLVPFLIIAMTSVMYWAWTESRGVGDLRPYAIVQFLPMLLIPVLLITSRNNSRLVPAFWYMILFYVLAKIAEFFDAAIFDFGQLFSGHSLKHLFAAAAPAILLLALSKNSGEAGDRSANL